ncbi:Kinesin KP1 [Spatholobus suberectus]|nr:Kinesin KP1 [Spatholobus suberectus]
MKGCFPFCIGGIGRGSVVLLHLAILLAKVNFLQDTISGPLLLRCFDANDDIEEFSSQDDPDQGGQAKTLMFVHLNPDVASYSKTISTLKFAKRVSGIQLASLNAIVRKDEEIERLQLVKANHTWVIISKETFHKDSPT